MKSYLVVLAAAALAGTVVAEAASFDCKGASSRIDMAICASPQVSRLDDELSEAYGAALRMQLDLDEVRSAQRAWLRNTRNKCQDEECLIGVYGQRITALKSLAVPSKEEVESDDADIPTEKDRGAREQREVVSTPQAAVAAAQTPEVAPVAALANPPETSNSAQSPALTPSAQQTATTATVQVEATGLEKPDGSQVVSGVIAVLAVLLVAGICGLYIRRRARGVKQPDVEAVPRIDVQIDSMPADSGKLSRWQGRSSRFAALGAVAALVGILVAGYLGLPIVGSSSNGAHSQATMPPATSATAKLLEGLTMEQLDAKVRSTFTQSDIRMLCVKAGMMMGSYIDDIATGTAPQAQKEHDERLLRLVGEGASEETRRLATVFVQRQFDVGKRDIVDRDPQKYVRTRNALGSDAIGQFALTAGSACAERLGASTPSQQSAGTSIEKPARPTKPVPDADMVCGNMTNFMLERTQFWLSSLGNDPQQRDVNLMMAQSRIRSMAAQWERSDALVKIWTMGLQEIDSNPSKAVRNYELHGAGPFASSYKVQCLKILNENGLR